MPSEISVQNPVANELVQLLGGLKPGIYRSTMTVCRIDFNPDGTEKAAVVVLNHCVDFDVTPPALEGGAS